MTDTIEVSGDYRLKASQSLTFSDPLGFLLLDGAWRPQLDLRGSASIRPDQGDATGVSTDTSAADSDGAWVQIGKASVLEVVALRGTATGVALSFDNSQLRNLGQLRVSADATSQAVGVVLAGTGERLTNDGMILASAARVSIAIDASAAPGARIDNHDMLQASAQETARGVLLGDHARFVNGGSLDVDSHGDAVGIVGGAACRVYDPGAIFVHGESAVGVELTGAQSFLNQGQLTVRGDASADAVVIHSAIAGVTNLGAITAKVLAGDGPSRGLVMDLAKSGHSLSISNSGVIRADIAIQVEGVRPILLTNHDLIQGDILLGGGGDVVDNRGQIRGDVRLGAGDDHFANIGGVTHGEVRGEGGDDQLEGGDGADRLIGGAGKDLLSGGKGADRFVYEAVADSHGKAIDAITDLGGTDLIDLSAIDADATQAGDQAFHLAAEFSHHAGELVLTYQAETGATLLTADVDGDAKADLAVLIYGDQSGFSHFVL